MRKIYFIPPILILVLILASACFAGGEIGAGPAALSPPTKTAVPSATSLPTATFTPQPTFTPSATPIVILDPEPIEVSFTASDGIELSGKYYPADQNPAPLIVLFQWAEGDQADWEQIALWLQNRDQLVKQPDYNQSWLSSDWFPENESQEPLGVFTFNLRNCAQGCQAFLPIEWLLDIESAMMTAANLQGVDRQQILTAGASIGADGAIYGCVSLNRAGEGNCRGSFSLSPASLLTIDYSELVVELAGDQAQAPIYCLYGLRDDASVETCDQLPGIRAIDFGYIENHGMELFQPGLEQDPLQLLLEYISSSLESE